MAKDMQGEMQESTLTPRKGIWSLEMTDQLKREYATARAEGKLRELADRLGVQLYDVYNKAHRLGLSRAIRKR
jgi:hypothetical protein